MSACQVAASACQIICAIHATVGTLRTVFLGRIIAKSVWAHLITL